MPPPVVGRKTLFELKDVLGAEVPAVGGEELQATRRLRQTILKTNELSFPTHQTQAHVQEVGG